MSQEFKPTDKHTEAKELSIPNRPDPIRGRFLLFSAPRKEDPKIPATESSALAPLEVKALQASNVVPTGKRKGHSKRTKKQIYQEVLSRCNTAHKARWDKNRLDITLSSVPGIRRLSLQDWRELHQEFFNRVLRPTSPPVSVILQSIEAYILKKPSPSKKPVRKKAKKSREEKQLEQELQYYQAQNVEAVACIQQHELQLAGIQQHLESTPNSNGDEVSTKVSAERRAQLDAMAEAIVKQMQAAQLNLSCGAVSLFQPLPMKPEEKPNEEEKLLVDINVIRERVIEQLKVFLSKKPTVETVSYGLSWIKDIKTLTLQDWQYIKSKINNSKPKSDHSVVKFINSQISEKEKEPFSAPRISI